MQTTRLMLTRRILQRRRKLHVMPGWRMIFSAISSGPADTQAHGAARALVGLTSLALGGLAGLLACSSDSPLAPGTAGQDLETGFWSLTVNHEAVTLSTVVPADTIRLVATPRNAHGVPLTGPVLDSLVTTYRLQNPRDTSVTITGDGLVRARYTHEGSLLIVSTQVRGLTRADTIPVNVTDTAPPPQAAVLALSVTPDTLTDVLTFGGTPPAVTAQVLDGGGVEIPHAAVRFLTDTVLVQLDVPRGASTGSLSARHRSPARVWLVAEATVYGTRVRDSVPVTFTPPAFITLTPVFGTPRSVGSPVGHFEPAVDTLTLGTHQFGDVGALVAFKNPTATPIDVVWDDPAAVLGSNITLGFCGAAPGGNLAAFVAPPRSGGGFCGIVRRTFGELRLLPTPGTYHFHSALYGTEGTIVVVPR